MQSFKVHELAPPTCVLLLSKNLILFFSPMLLPLCSCPCPISSFCTILRFSYLSYVCTISPPYLSYLCNISPPLSSISIKVCFLLMQRYALWGRWLRLEFYIFYGHYLIVGMTLLVDTILNF